MLPCRTQANYWTPAIGIRLEDMYLLEPNDANYSLYGRDVPSTELLNEDLRGARKTCIAFVVHQTQAWGDGV